MNHDYYVMKLHETRAAELQEEARQDSVARQVLRAKRALAQLAAAEHLPQLPRRTEATPQAAGTGPDRHAA